MHLRRSHIALLFALVLHAAIVIYMAIKRVDFYPTNRWTYMRMQLAASEKPAEIPSPIAEPVHPEDVFGVEARRREVAKTNEAVNEAMKNLSRADEEKLSKKLQEQYEREVRELSTTGLMSGNKKGSLEGSTSSEKAVTDTRPKAAEKGLERTGNKTLEASNISFYLPNRTEGISGLRNPVYMCQSGGVVVVDIAVDINGVVTGAKVNKKLSETSDPCLIEAAENSALSSSFNVSDNAPERQRGTITYRFQYQ
jgi:hypothetical protein